MSKCPIKCEGPNASTCKYVKVAVVCAVGAALLYYLYRSSSSGSGTNEKKSETSVHTATSPGPTTNSVYM
ncbi:hypothetical protein AAVH_02308 [Aphelenchoides avenae]|nr:hypothetical protein AAVH_02308 [Aphelenchus avenae]